MYKKNYRERTQVEKQEIKKPSQLQIACKDLSRQPVSNIYLILHEKDY